MTDKIAIKYIIKPLEVQSNTLDITIKVENNKNDLLLLKMPIWRPGRYCLMDYAKDVTLFNVTDKYGNLLNNKKIDKTTWEITTNNESEIIVNYKYYANTLDAGSSLWDGEQLFITGITCLMYIPDRKDEPNQLLIEGLSNCKCATPLKSNPNKEDSYRWNFIADNYDELVDHPLIISKSLIIDELKIDKTIYHICYQGDGNYDREKIKGDIEKIVKSQVTMMGDMPCEEYYFLYQIPQPDKKHGLEHRDSTVIVFGPAYKFDDNEHYDLFMGFTSHEFYHLWNIKRIKPDVLYPFKYDEIFYTPTFFVAEGFTCYYGDLSLIRSGVWDKEKYFKNLAKHMTFEAKTYGRNITSLAMSSWDSWISHYQQGNPNQHISFYLKGELVGLLLDMEIRKNSNNKSNLDDVMKIFYNEYAKKDKGYTLESLLNISSECAGKNLKVFFNDYILSTKKLNYDILQEYAGIKINKIDDDEEEALERLGIKFIRNSFGQVGKVQPESDAYKAGVQQGDEIIAINNKKISSDNIKSLMNYLKSKNEIEISLFRNNILYNLKCNYTQKSSWKYSIDVLENQTEEQKANLKTWLWI